MLNFFHNKSLAAQLSLVIAGLMIVANLIMTTLITEQARDNLETDAEQALTRQGELVSDLLEFYYRDSFLNAQRLSDIFFNMFPQGVTLTDRQVQVADYRTLALADENGVINGDFSKPDQFTRMTGGTATVFARHGDDFLRISTSLKNREGKRAFGTLLGQQHPGYKTLMAGKTYHGVARLFGREYMTIYRPVQDNGRTIAVLYIGFDLTQGLAELKKTLQKVRIGDTGYISLVAGKNSMKAGELVMHPELEGRNITDIRVADGQRPFDAVLQQEAGIMRYTDPTTDVGPREKLAVFRSVDGWNWSIILSSYSDEFAQTSRTLRNSMIVLMLISTLAIILISGLMLYRRLSPLRRVTQDLVAIGQGQLNVTPEPIRVSADCNNETRLLRKATAEMHQGLKDLVQQLGQAADALKQSVSQVQTASGNTESAVDQQSLEIQQVVSAMEEMAATTADVAENAREAADTTARGQDKAAKGHEASDMIHASIEDLVAEMGRASSLIQEVSTESNNISAFMTTISEVAEQTNLLALNAAIEAARAGESGRGFAVVADEVRTLAGRTQQATLEITQLVDRLQEKIDQAVQAISGSNEASCHSQARTSDARGALEEISTYMTHIADMGSNIATASEQQAAVAETVTQSLHSISQLSGNTRLQSDACVAASEDLQQVAADIESKLARFRV